MNADDPVKMFEHSSLTTNSVLKLFIDLFSTMETASLFYTNDNKVLIDIIVRQLSDISPGDLVCIVVLCIYILFYICTVCSLVEFCT